MQYDSCHLSGVRLRTDRLSYDVYDITDFNFVSEFHLYVTVCFQI